jgi:hypothetical protein
MAKEDDNLDLRLRHGSVRVTIREWWLFERLSFQFDCCSVYWDEFDEINGFHYASVCRSTTGVFAWLANDKLHVSEQSDGHKSTWAFGDTANRCFWGTYRRQNTSTKRKLKHRIRTHGRLSWKNNPSGLSLKFDYFEWKWSCPTQYCMVSEYFWQFL